MAAKAEGPGSVYALFNFQGLGIVLFLPWVEGDWQSAWCQSPPIFPKPQIPPSQTRCPNATTPT